MARGRRDRRKWSPAKSRSSGWTPSVASSVFARSRWLLVAVAVLALAGCRRESDEPRAPIRAAVAANFAAPMESLAKAFEAETGTAVTISAGSTGKLFTQIENGAPFDVFLSADALRPELLEKKGLAVKGSRFTYAVGRLALYGPGVRHPGDGLLDLREAKMRHVSIANPDIAPYGVAARQVMERAGVLADLSERIVRGENITQAFQFVDTGGAEVGFVALSSVVNGAKHPYWVVPETLHEPIRQDAVLLERPGAHPRSRELSAFMRSPAARKIIEAAGYSVPGG